jgi:hypothetical protein
VVFAMSHRRREIPWRHALLGRAGYPGLAHDPPCRVDNAQARAFQSRARHPALGSDRSNFVSRTDSPAEQAGCELPVPLRRGVFPNRLFPPLLAAKPCRDRWTQPERDRWFESVFLQGRVHKPSVPPPISRGRPVRFAPRVPHLMLAHSRVDSNLAPGENPPPKL